MINALTIRKNKIETFKYIHDKEENNIETINKMIKIKEDFMDLYNDNFALKCIHEMYKRIIDIHMNHKEGDDVSLECSNKIKALFQKYPIN